MVLSFLYKKINNHFKIRKEEKRIFLFSERDRHINNIDKYMRDNKTKKHWTYTIANSKNGHFTDDEHKINSLVVNYYSWRRGYYAYTKIDTESQYCCLKIVIRNHYPTITPSRNPYF